MGEQSEVLVLDLGPESLGSLVLRIRRLRLPVLHARAPGEAERLIDAEGERIRAVLFHPELPEAERQGLMTQLRQQAFEGPPTLVVVGRPPSAEIRAGLRAEGLEQALWEPFDDRTLRFVVNEALAPPSARATREGIRVPASVMARVESGGRVRQVHTYSLSTTGAFLETPRPSVRGTRLGVEIPLPDGVLLAEAQVVFSNVPGNLQRPNLPLGMGVRFDGLSREEAARLRRCVEARATQLLV